MGGGFGKYQNENKFSINANLTYGRWSVDIDRGNEQEDGGT